MRVHWRFLWTHWVIGAWYVNYGPTYKALCLMPLPMVVLLISWGENPTAFFKDMGVNEPCELCGGKRWIPVNPDLPEGEITHVGCPDCNTVKTGNRIRKLIRYLWAVAVWVLEGVWILVHWLFMGYGPKPWRRRWP